jgi:hypothetical protein
MTLIKNKFNYGNEVFFVSIMVLEFAPQHYKLPVLGILYLCLITAAFIDCKKNAKRVRRITRRVASRRLVKARETISHRPVPQLLQINSTVYGAEAT